ncbi:UNVERIFIED_ORG: hypothetical protein ABID57_003328 [Arthrobacter sp. UYEF1]
MWITRISSLKETAGSTVNETVPAELTAFDLSLGGGDPVSMVGMIFCAGTPAAAHQR